MLVLESVRGIHGQTTIPESGGVVAPGASCSHSSIYQILYRSTGIGQTTPAVCARVIRVSPQSPAATAAKTALSRRVESAGGRPETSRSERKRDGRGQQHTLVGRGAVKR